MNRIRVVAKELNDDLISQLLHALQEQIQDFTEEMNATETITIPLGENAYEAGFYDGKKMTLEHTINSLNRVIYQFTYESGK